MIDCVFLAPFGFSDYFIDDLGNLDLASILMYYLRKWAYELFLFRKFPSSFKWAPEFSRHFKDSSKTISDRIFPVGNSFWAKFLRDTENTPKYPPDNFFYNNSENTISKHTHTHKSIKIGIFTPDPKKLATILEPSHF